LCNASKSNVTSVTTIIHMTKVV